MTVPSTKTAEEMICEAERMNPGLWIDHSRATAENARIIAEKCALDPDAAYALGLLHDIGRRQGRCHMRHIYGGHQYLMERGFDDAAAICLTHSFPIKNMNTFMGAVDVSEAEYAFIERFLMEREYTEYDRLIQLCDAVSLKGGGILIEKRLLGVAMRYGVTDIQREKWAATFALKAHFDELAGVNVYRLLPDIVQNTFEW